MTIGQYAEHAGVNRKTISRWIKAGTFVVMDGKKINAESTDANLKRFRDSTDPRVENGQKTRAARKARESQSGTVEGFEQQAREVFDLLITGDIVIRPLEESRAMKEHFFAEMARLEYEDKDGKLFPLKLVTEEVAAEYTRVRTRLVALAPEHGPRLRALAGMTDDQGFTAALQELIYEALDELAFEKREIEEDPA
ncbi:RNA polymerase subunit sigma-70 [Escherichia coli]|nr:RNA polymerase subunit sigma-70 [Escherichia coli]MED8844557.1 RNA polymerase subunit sigma-70 [Escherichia coli]MED9368265.1 RNA polymerase subunit sigma-70 [Escherichia coli]MED9701664.1 RNA polymerase subunit sigma-70 [Escherichia coli]HAY0218973.1 RNA polymerase subunit sigma-70 [Escherichia coli]